MTARRIFRPPLWATLLTAAGVASFGALGVWQSQRGLQKARFQAQLEQAPAGSAALSSRSAPGEDFAWRRVTAAGRYVDERTLLLDGQGHQGRPGRHVWTPLRLADGTLVLVDRGWIALDAPATAAPAGDVVVQGLWRSLPRPGLRLESHGNCPEARKFPAVVQYPTTADLACLLGEPALNGVLLLDARAPGGYVRAWAAAGLPPARHYAYAAQWFALALTALVLYAVLNLKRAPPDRATRGQAPDDGPRGQA